MIRRPDRDTVAYRDGLLHNMSARPRTEIRRQVGCVRQPWVGFCWAGPTPSLDSDRRARLDRWWRETGITGAVIVHPLRSIALPRMVAPQLCAEPVLLLNVLLRTRGNLLLASMPLLDDPAALNIPGIATEDPRMVALVGAGVSNDAAVRAALGEALAGWR